MGMYTELILGCSLKRDTPKNVIDTLRYLCGSIKKPENLEWDSRRNPLSCGSYYFGICDPVNKMWKDKIRHSWIISARSNIKNYDGEIESFLEWLKPYIERGSGERDMYALVIYEEQSEPTIYYLRE